MFASQYTLFANASTYGSPTVRALWFEFPEEPELFGIDRQYLVGRDILVTPVLDPNVTTVAGVFPGRGNTIWRDWYTHKAVNVSSTPGATVTLDAPLGHINVHIRDGSAILLHAKPGYTTTETREGPYELLVSLDKQGRAFGTAYVDDGESVPPTPHTNLKFWAEGGVLFIEADAPNAAVDDYGDFAPTVEFNRLIPAVDYTDDISTFPFVVLQVS